ncbi:hypothetical protein [Streptomyces sp. NPDC002913]
MSDIDLSPLNPLARVIADAVHNTPVRLGPGGADGLISTITIRVAAYMGREVLPQPAATEADATS